MSEHNTDVDLDKALELDESVEPDTTGASDRKSEDGQDNKTATADEELSPRAKERIDALLADKATLEAKLSEQEKKPADPDLDSFINSIEDEPSRNLLRTFGNLVEKKLESRFSPVLSDFQEQQFEKQFAEYAKIPGLEAFKDDLKKTFSRDPKQSLKALVGAKLVDLQTSKIKPIESTASEVSRGTKKTLDEASKDDLYDLLESNRK